MKTINIEKYRELIDFEELEFLAWEAIFHQWDIDDKIYIIDKWRISIEQFLWLNREKNRKIAVIWPWAIFWEKALYSPHEEKKSSAIALSDVSLLSINRENFKQKTSSQKNSDKVLSSFLWEVITQSNDRLNSVNQELWYIFEFTSFLSRIHKIKTDTLSKIIKEIMSLIFCDYIVFLKKHHIIEDTYITKYDTRDNKFLWEVFEKKSGLLPIDEVYERLEINQNENIMVNKISIWDDELWYLICSRVEQKWWDHEKKIMKSFAMSLTWIVQKLDIKEDQKNKDMLDNI